MDSAKLAAAIKELLSYLQLSSFVTPYEAGLEHPHARQSHERAPFSTRGSPGYC
jgi:hypothetical protein